MSLEKILESEGAKRHFHSYRLLLFLMKIKITALSDLIINVLKNNYMKAQGVPQ